ncbi:MAG TPA: Omp28-related outer membrane protein [Saprospiraceae bacterium]|nr:Omp28-related outer membrane protein [Saprospiraceae bacterium]
MRIINFLIVFLLLTSCDEEKKMIVPITPGNRVVLLEEFTGKGCTNCPKGSREIENLLTQFPDNLVTVSIHAGFFADPQFFPIGQYDLRTVQGQELYDYLGPNQGYPAGVVDRTRVGNKLQIDLNQWASAINRDLQVDPAVELVLIHNYDSLSRTLTLTINGISNQDIIGELRLSVMLTESGIVDAQDDFEAGGIVPNYVHNHVLRDMLTPATGEAFSNNLTSGQTFTRTYSTTLSDQWVAGNMEVVAFVSVVNGNTFPVLQAVSAHVTN